MAGIAIKIMGANYSASGLGKVTLKGAAIPVTAITINGNASITNTGQYTAVLTPNNTTQPRVVWSITSGSDYATIDQNGLVTAKAGANNNSVTIKCTSADNSSIFVTKTIRVSYVKEITGISISGPSSVTDSGQFSAALTPNDTTQTGIVWSITSGGNYASIDQNGLLTALEGASNNSVTIKCQSSAKQSVYATKTVTVSKTAAASPTLTSPNVSSIDVGTIAAGDTSVSKAVTVRGENITQPVTISVTGTGFSVNKDSLTAAQVLAGYGIAILYTNEKNVNISATGELRITSSEGLDTRIELTAAKQASQPTASLVTDGLIRNFDAYGANSTTLQDLTGNGDSINFAGASGNNTVGNNKITAPSSEPYFMVRNQESAGFLNNLDQWTMEFVVHMNGWANNAILKDLFHDASQEGAAKHVVYMSPDGTYCKNNGGVLCRQSNSNWGYLEWEDSVLNIDWSVPHVIHITREYNASQYHFKMYLDGGKFVTQAQGSITGMRASYSQKADLLMAELKPNNTANVNGAERSMYAIRVYNKALSAAEVAQNYAYNVDRYGLTNS